MSRPRSTFSVVPVWALCVACGRLGYDLLDTSAAPGGSGGSAGASASGGSAATSGAPGGGASGASVTGGSGGNSGSGGGSAGGGGSSGNAGAGPQPTCTPTSAGECPASCSPNTFNGVLYMFCTDLVTAADAALVCLEQGMQVVSVDTAEENAFITQVLTASVWLGGSDAAVEGEWRWPDGVLFWNGQRDGMAPAGAYAHFGNADPNDAGGNENCVVMNTAGFWADYPCDMTFGFVCEQY